VLDVLDVLDRQGPTTLAQLARETGTAKSTLHRVCSLMCERGWIARDSRSGCLELGPRVAWLARAAPVSPLAAGFHGVAERLVARHNETTCLTVLDGRDSLFIAKEETTHAVRLVTSVGSRLPAFAAASGRVMLADRPEEAVVALYEDCELETPTGRRLDGLDELLRILRDARRRGYAENVDETSLGLHCLAAPVGPAGRVVAAITLCVPSGRMTPARRREMLRDLLAAAREMVPAAAAGGPLAADGHSAATDGPPDATVRGSPATDGAPAATVRGSPASGGRPDPGNGDPVKPAETEPNQSSKLSTLGATVPRRGGRRRRDSNRKVAP
jgi:DNA-binding IclR family transcriptional regulator